jgi:hypothetical protein
MKNTKIIAIILLVCLALSACTQNGANQTETIQNTDNNTEEAYMAQSQLQSEVNKTASSRSPTFVNTQNYEFYGTISEEVLKNYLSRSISLTIFGHGDVEFEDRVRIILDIGAKYIQRAAIPWIVGEWDNPMHWAEDIKRLHEKDPDILVESCIFETVHTDVNKKPIPAFAFEAFGLPVETRNFSYDAMRYADGRYLDLWGEGASVPDITRIDTQLWFYTRATELIDAGFEVLHMGQVVLMGENDKAAGYPSWKKVFDLVRVYAKTHARRGMVLINAHSYEGMKDVQDNLFFDFAAGAMGMQAVAGSVFRPPSPDNPQETDIAVGQSYSIFMKTLGGITPSGWWVERLPFIVEIDNYGPPPVEYLNNPNMWVWGYDEASWFANQPDSYRRQWLKDIYVKVNELDPQGFFCLIGNRPAFIYDANLPEKLYLEWYHASNRYRFKDEATLKEIFSVSEIIPYDYVTVSPVQAIPEAVPESELTVINSFDMPVKFEETSLSAGGNIIRQFSFDPVDISILMNDNTYVEFYLYVNDTGLMTRDFHFELTSSGEYDIDEYEFTKGPIELSNGWNLIRFSMIHGKISGNPNLAAINFSRYFTTNAQNGLEFRVRNLRVVEYDTPAALVITGANRVR